MCPTGFFYRDMSGDVAGHNFANVVWRREHTDVIMLEKVLLHASEVQKQNRLKTLANVS